MFHCYDNNPNYGCTHVQSVFKPHKEPEVQYVDEAQHVSIPEIKAKKYLPGERLLKKLNKKQQEQKKKKNDNLNMDTIHQSISEILDDLT